MSYREDGRAVGMRKAGCLCVVAMAVLAAAIPGRGRAAEPFPLRVAWNIPAGDVPLALYGKPGIAVHEGKSYTLDLVHLGGTPPDIAALAEGEVDIAPLGFASLSLAIDDAKIEDLRIIADLLQDGVENHYSDEFMVLNDGPIKAIEDLKGKVVAANVINGAVDIGLRTMLKKHGLQEKRDYTLIELAFPDMKPQLLARKVDLISAVLPFSQDRQLRAVAHTLFVQKDAMGASQLLFMAARNGFLQKHRAVVVDFLEDNLRELRWYSDPAHHDEAIKIVADYTHTPPSLWSSWLFTDNGLYRAPNGKPDLAALRRNITTAHEMGFLKSNVDPTKYADLSLVDEAAKRIK